MITISFGFPGSNSDYIKCIKIKTICLTQSISFHIHQVKLYPFIHRFEHIPLATPNGDILIRDLSFEVNVSMFP